MPETSDYKLELDESKRIIKTKLKTTGEQKMSQSQMAGRTTSGLTCWKRVGEDSGVRLGSVVFNAEVTKKVKKVVFMLCGNAIFKPHYNHGWLVRDETVTNRSRFDSQRVIH